MKRNFTKFPAYDKESQCWRAIIETPKGSRHKFDYDPKLGCFQLKKTLPEGMCFPLDFGFVPGTLGEDGDPVDVMVMLDAPAVMGVLVKVRIVGAIKAEQKEKDGSWARNDRLLAVMAENKKYDDIKSIDDLRPRRVEELTAFFEQYNRLQGKKFRPFGACDAAEAEGLLRKGMKKVKT